MQRVTLPQIYFRIQIFNIIQNYRGYKTIPPGYFKMGIVTLSQSSQSRHNSHIEIVPQNIVSYFHIEIIQPQGDNNFNENYFNLPLAAHAPQNLHNFNKNNFNPGIEITVTTISNIEIVLNFITIPMFEIVNWRVPNGQSPIASPGWRVPK